MTREVAIFNHPVTEPGFCGKCGSQHRDWFVDLGFDTIFNRPENVNGTPIWTDGTIYLCSECYRNLVTDLNRRFEQFLIDIPFTHRGFTLPVGLEEKLLPLVEAKYPKEVEDDGPEAELGSEPDAVDAYGDDPEPDEPLGEDDGQSESDDFGFRIKIESAELVDG